MSSPVSLDDTERNNAAPNPSPVDGSIPPLFSIEDLRTEYFLEHGAIRAVDGLHLEIKTGEVVAVVGESGSGKSASALSAMRLIPHWSGRITRGRILFRGQDILALSDRAMRSVRGRHIAMIFQNPTAALNPLLSVGSQLSETARLHRKLKQRDAVHLSRSMLSSLEIADPDRVMQARPFQLSGGMNQRVMLALALLGEPELLIADEPTTMLDVITQGEILRLIERTQRATGMAVWLISHDLGVVARMANRVVVMYMGQPVESGSAMAVIDTPKHPYTVALRDSVPTLHMARHRLSQITGSPPDPQHPPAGCRFASRCPHAMEVCVRQEPPELVAGNGSAVKCWLYA